MKNPSRKYKILYTTKKIEEANNFRVITTLPKGLEFVSIAKA